MKQKTYRTAQGRVVDLGAMIAQNETVRAVGNMNVNARGDIIDNQGRILSTRGEQVNRNLNRQTNATSGPVASSTRAQNISAATAQPTQFNQTRSQSQSQSTSSQGLAAAMARAEKLKDQE